MNEIIINSRISGKTAIMVMHMKTELQNGRSVSVIGMGEHLRIIRMLDYLGVKAEAKPMMKNKEQVGFTYSLKNK